MLMTKERRPAFRTTRGWAIAVLHEVGAIRECDEHGCGIAATRTRVSMLSTSVFWIRHPAFHPKKRATRSWKCSIRSAIPATSALSRRAGADGTG